MSAQRPPDPMQRTANRLTALLMTVPGHARNYTATVDEARWVIEEAERLGWKVAIDVPSLEDLIAARDKP